jgi:hypothetical protein
VSIPRKASMVIAALAISSGMIAATATVAAAKVTKDAVGAPATASCTSSGGTLSFKYPVGISGSGYTPPAKNKGNQITVSGVTETCTSSAVSGSFTGTVSGKIKTADKSETPATFYSCAGLTGVSPSPGGTLKGKLTIKWAAPAGQKFSPSKTKSVVSSVLGGTTTSGGQTYGTFTIPGVPGTGSVSGAFPGSDGGASSSSTTQTADTETQLLDQCETAGGLSTIALGPDTSSLK